VLNRNITPRLPAWALCAGSCLLVSCRRAGVLDPQGPVSAAERLILLNATGIMLVVVVPVIMMTLSFAWWYRASNKRASYRPDWSYSGSVELVTWAVPAMVVILLAGVAWIGSHELDPAVKLKSDQTALRIQVVAMDWKWLFIYPQHGVATLNQVVVPAGTPVEFVITSATVMNAFFVPQLGTQIYAMPGMTTRLNLQADRPGDYAGLSSHFSGDGFSDMHFLLRALTAQEFANWLDGARGSSLILGDVGYQELLLPTHNDSPQTFGKVEPMLYERILRLAAPPSSASSKGN
jgi:cytochrome o ubiquinol oxidase subunit II